MTPATPALELTDLHSWRGTQPALEGLSLSVAIGQAVSLFCPDDFHRNALLEAILGLADRREGSLRIHGTEAIHLPMERIHALGVAYHQPLPDVLPSLSCEENLLVPPVQGSTLGGGLSLTEIYALFPILHEQRQQPGASLPLDQLHLLSLGRMLRTGANLIVLDAICERVRGACLDILAQAIDQLKAQSYTLLLLERACGDASRLADHCYAVDTRRATPCTLQQETAGPRL